MGDEKEMTMIVSNLSVCYTFRERNNGRNLPKKVMPRTGDLPKITRLLGNL